MTTMYVTGCSWLMESETFLFSLALIYANPYSVIVIHMSCCVMYFKREMKVLPEDFFISFWKETFLVTTEITIYSAWVLFITLCHTIPHGKL